MPTSTRRFRGGGAVPSIFFLSALLQGRPVGPPAPAPAIAEVMVVGLDYAYQAPATLRPGLTAFGFENHGKVRHEVSIARLKPGASLDSLMHSEPGVGRIKLMQSAGILVADPGGRALGRILVDLAPGETYVFLCNFQDAPNQPRHLAIGMFTSIQVK